MVRKLQHSDLEQVMQIWLAGNREAHRFVPAEYWESNAPMVREQLLQSEVYVCEENGIVRGFAGLQGDYLAGIFVEKSARSRGIGKQLLDYVKKMHATFHLHVFQENSRAVKFYQREGLVVADESRNEDTGNREYTMVWRRKR